MIFSEVVNFCVVLSVLVLSTSAALLSNEIQNDTPTKKCGTVRKANGSLHLKQGKHLDIEYTKYAKCC